MKFSSNRKKWQGVQSGRIKGGEIFRFDENQIEALKLKNSEQNVLHFIEILLK